MKKLVLLIAFAVPILSFAQEIRYENGKFGMINSSGEAMLEYEYDHISNILQFGRKSQYYKFRIGTKYGLYSTLDFKSTGCVYDSVFLDLNVIYIRNGALLGFVAQTENSYKVIEPQYKDLYPMSEIQNYGRRPILSLHNYNISVQKNGLWGVVRHSDGGEVLTTKYKFEVSYLDDFFWVMKDTARTEILINPETGVEFRTGTNGHYSLNKERTYLLVYDHHVIGTTMYRTAVYNYDSGQLLWEYFSEAYRVTAEFVSEEIVQVHEEYNRDRTLRSGEENKYTFYNITNGSPLLSHAGGDYCVVEVKDEDNKLIVYATDSYNGRPKLVGQIFK